MKCPVDGTELRIADRNGVEIDYCPQCRGVWLDRGELDKIIERAAANEERETYRPTNDPRGYAQPQPYRYDDDDDDYERRRYDQQHPKKKRGFLGEMFDIFD